MRRVHLIGVNHCIQHDRFIDDPAIAGAIGEFQEYLRLQVETTGATVLAEEFPPRNNSTVAHVARKLGIRHLPCDLEQIERDRLGICTNDQRENHWASLLAPLTAEEIIFVCGDTHIETFPAALERHGLKSCVLSKGRGRDLCKPVSLSDLGSFG